MTGSERYYTSAGDIFSVLRTLQADRSPINIQFQSLTTPFSTIVLHVNLREKVFHLDEFSLPVAHKRAIEGDPFAIYASINGIRVHAKDLVVKRVGVDRDGEFYEVAFPERLLYLQRRDAFRALVPTTMSTDVVLTRKNELPKVKGRLQNMSATGFRVVVEGRLKPDFEMLESMQAKMELALVEHTLDCPVEAVYSQFAQETNQTICGFQFGNLGRQDQVSINRFVTQLQRNSIVD